MTHGRLPEGDAVRKKSDGSPTGESVSAGRHLRIRRDWYAFPLRIPQGLRGFLWGIVVAVAIEVALAWAHHRPTPLLERIEDQAMDAMIAVSRGQLAPAAMIPPFVWIDIDEATFSSWGEPIQLPRDKLTALLRFAWKSRPKLVLLDIDLSRPSSEVDDPLISFFRSLPARGNERTQAGIILPYTFRAPYSSDGADLPNLRRSPLASIIPADAAVYWASYQYDRDPDWTIRRWRMWEGFCDGSRFRSAIGIPLIVASLLSETPETLDNLHGALDLHFARSYRDACARNPRESYAEADTPRPTGSSDFLVGNITIHVPPSDLNQRIAYVVPWQPFTETAMPQTLHDGRVEQAVTRVPARLIMNAIDHDGQTNAALLQDKVVVIGGSFEESRDIHRTPLSDMPGSLVVMNSVLSLLGRGQLREPGLLARLAILVPLVLVTVLIFGRLSSFWALWLALAVIVVAFLPLSFRLFASGVWLDFALPILGVFAHNLYRQWEVNRRIGHGE